MNCAQDVFEDYLAKCNDVINVYAQLEPLTSYHWVITDFFGNKYQGDFTTDGDGFWEILVADLPVGLITQYAGTFVLEVFAENGGCKPLSFKIAQDYNEIRFTIKSGTFVKDTLGCNFNCIGTGDQNILVPFSGVGTYVIDYDGLGYDDILGNAPVVQVYILQYSGLYALTTVQVTKEHTDDLLTEIAFDFGGLATGYIILS